MKENDSGDDFKEPPVDGPREIEDESFYFVIDGPDGRTWEPSRDAFIAGLQRDFETGDDKALLRAISCCAQWGIPIPDWAASPFVEKIEGIEYSRNWEEIFGPMHERHYQAKVWKKRMEVTPSLYLDIEDGRNEGLSLESLYETVGKLYGLSPKTAELYYRKFIENDLMLSKDDFKKPSKK